jgi:hypothetical protein
MASRPSKRSRSQRGFTGNNPHSPHSICVRPAATTQTNANPWMDRHMSQGEPPPRPTPKTPLASPHIQNHLVTPVQPQSPAIHHQPILSKYFNRTAEHLHPTPNPSWIRPHQTHPSPKAPAEQPNRSLSLPRATSSAPSTPQHRLATFQAEFSGGHEGPGGLHLPRWTHWRAALCAPREATPGGSLPCLTCYPSVTHPRGPSLRTQSYQGVSLAASVTEDHSTRGRKHELPVTGSTEYR